MKRERTDAQKASLAVCARSGETREDAECVLRAIVEGRGVVDTWIVCPRDRDVMDREIAFVERPETTPRTATWARPVLSRKFRMLFRSFARG